MQKFADLSMHIFSVANTFSWIVHANLIHWSYLFSDLYTLDAWPQCMFHGSCTVFTRFFIVQLLHGLSKQFHSGWCRCSMLCVCVPAPWLVHTCSMIIAAWSSGLSGWLYNWAQSSSLCKATSRRSWYTNPSSRASAYNNSINYMNANCLYSLQAPEA